MIKDEEDEDLPEGVEKKITRRKENDHYVIESTTIDKRFIKDPDNPFLRQLYGDSCFRSIIRDIEDHTSLRNLKIEKEVPSFITGLKGTGVCNGGYSFLVSLIEESTNIVAEDKKARRTYAFVKYSGKHGDFQNAERGGRLTSFLYKIGHRFIPYVFLPDLSLMSDSFFDSGLHLPLIFEFLPGRSLENRINESIFYSKEPPANMFHLTPEFSSIFQDVMNSMFKIYSDQRLRKGTIEHLLGRYELLSGKQPDIINPVISQRFHKNLINRFSFDNTGFIHRFNHLYISELNGLSVCLVHGDLHQGNIILREDGHKILDWDNASLGTPYQDFFHFSLISGFENNSDYENAKIEMKKRYESLESMPVLSEKYYTLLEFEVYLSLLDRYYRSATEDILGSGIQEKMLQTCNYLLDRSKESLKKYTELTKNRSIFDYYSKFTDLNYSRIYHTYKLDPPIHTTIAIRNTQTYFDSRRDITGFEVPFAHAAYHLFDKRINEMRESNNLIQHRDNLKPFLR